MSNSYYCMLCAYRVLHSTLIHWCIESSLISIVLGAGSFYTWKSYGKVKIMIVAWSGINTCNRKILLKGEKANGGLCLENSRQMNLGTGIK